MARALAKPQMGFEDIKSRRERPAKTGSGRKTSQRHSFDILGGPSDIIEDGAIRIDCQYLLARWHVVHVGTLELRPKPDAGFGLLL